MYKKVLSLNAVSRNLFPPLKRSKTVWFNFWFLLKFNCRVLPESIFRASVDESLNTFPVFRKPTWQNPKILTPEGELHEAWVAKIEVSAAKVEKDANASIFSLKKNRDSLESQSSSPSASGETFGVKKRKSDASNGHSGKKVKKPKKSDQFTYEVERIIGASLYKGKSEFLIKWKGYTLIESTWEPQDSMVQAEQAIARFYLDIG